MSSRAKFIILGLVVLYLLVALAECKTRKKHVEMPPEAHKAVAEHEAVKEKVHEKIAGIEKAEEHAAPAEGKWEEFKVKKLVKERERLLRELHKKEQEQKDLVKKYQALLMERDDEIARLKAKLSKLKAAAAPEEVQAELEACKKKIIELEKALTEAESSTGLSKAKDEIKRLQAELAKKNDDIAKLKETLAAQIKHNEELQEIVDKSGSEVQKALQLAKEKEERLMAELASAKKQIAELKKQLASRGAPMPMMQPLVQPKAPEGVTVDLEALKRELERAKAQLKAKEYTLEKARKEMETLKEGIEELGQQ